MEVILENHWWLQYKSANNVFFLQNSQYFKENNEFTIDRVTNRRDIIQSLKYNVDDDDEEIPESLMIVN